MKAAHFSPIMIEGSLVLLPGACGAIEASGDVQPLSFRRDCDITSPKTPNGSCRGSHRAPR